MSAILAELAESTEKSRTWAAVAALRVIAALFSQHIKPANFHGLLPVNLKFLVETYEAFVPQIAQFKKFNKIGRLQHIA
jgi:hypothetical protein